MTDIPNLIERLEALPWHEPAISEAAQALRDLQAKVDEDERMVKNCKGAVVIAKEWIAEKDEKIADLQAVADAARKLQGEIEGWAEDAGGYAPAWFDVKEALAKLDKP